MNNTREYLTADIDSIRRRIRVVGAGVWAVAAFVMIYGAPVSYQPLVGHGVPGSVAWMPSLAADVGMCIAIIAGPVLANYNIRSGWVGILRWIAAFTTWALQTAGSWLAPHGPDAAGVTLHSFPPGLLFVVAEAAAYFVRRMGRVLAEKRQELDAYDAAALAEKTRQADLAGQLTAVRAELAATTAAAEADRAAAAEQITDLTARLEQATGENTELWDDADRTAQEHTAAVTAMQGTIDDLTAQLTERGNELTASREYAADLSARLRESTAEREAERHTAALTAERLEAEMIALRSALTEQAERLTADHTAAVQRLTAEHAEDTRRLREKLTGARAGKRGDSGAVSLTAYRTEREGKASPSAGNRPRMTDEQAVQAMFDKHSDPLYDWSQPQVRTLTGAGTGRIPKLIDAWREYALTEQQKTLTAGSGEAAVNE